MRHLLRTALTVLVLSAALLHRRNTGNPGGTTSATTPTVNTANTGGQTTVTGILTYAGTEFQRGRVTESRQDPTQTPSDRQAIDNDTRWSNQDPKYQPNYGAIDEHGRATGISITMNNDVRTDMRHRTSPTSRDDVPPGYDSSQHHKGHLLGAQFGGSNTDARNFVPLYEDVNTPTMRQVENQVRDHMKNNPNDDFTYTVTPVYDDPPSTNPVPASVTMSLTDANGNPVQLKDPSGNLVDVVSIPNTP